MSQLYGSMSLDSKHPKKGGASKKVSAHVSTWVDGIRIEVSRNEVGELDCRVYRTGGSNNPESKVLVSGFHLEE